MEIHKPKPVHSWKELLGEIGVIVIGIVIALSGEQLIEANHRAHQRADLRAALDRDAREAVTDANRTVRFSEDFIAWAVTRIAEVRQAQAAHTPLAKSKKLTAEDFDLAVDPAFRAASTSGLLSLLPQDEVLAYSEADLITVEIDKAYDTFRHDVREMRVFDYNFRNPSGELDFSAATPAQLTEYANLLSGLVWSLDNMLHWNQEFANVEQALLHGERSLDALHTAERTTHTRIQALQMTW
jgi:hypothetical protein